MQLEIADQNWNVKSLKMTRKWYKIPTCKNFKMKLKFYRSNLKTLHSLKVNQPKTKRTAESLNKKIKKKLQENKYIKETTADETRSSADVQQSST